MEEDINTYIPSILYPRSEKKIIDTLKLNRRQNKRLSLTLRHLNSTLSTKNSLPNTKLHLKRIFANQANHEQPQLFKENISIEYSTFNLNIDCDSPIVMAPSKKKKSPKVSKSTINKSKDDKQKPISFYFGTRKNKTISKLSHQLDIQNNNTENTDAFSRAGDIPIIDLCNSSDSAPSITHTAPDTLVSSNNRTEPSDSCSTLFHETAVGSSTLLPRSSSSRVDCFHNDDVSMNKSEDTKFFGINNTSNLLQHGNWKGKKVPTYKIIEGTPFAVDAFSYGDLPGVKAYFLTHFHSDHYIGLKKSFNKTVYCTKITGELCQQKLYVKKSCIHLLELNETVNICGIDVTTVDANHCPGSVMFVFTLPNGRSILHCGDFRATDLMECYPIFWNKEIHTIYLDTTYCDPQYNFPTQSESIDLALSVLYNKEKSMSNAGQDFTKLLIVCGTYTIGKENFFLGIAEKIGIKIWAASDKNKILKTVLGRDFNTSPLHQCRLHVLPMMKLNYTFLDNYLKNLGSSFTEVIAFKPSGWECSIGSLVQRGNVTIHGIPYSEHSSFPELQRFTKFLQPKVIIPTVPSYGGAKGMQKYFSCWVGSEDQESQKKVSDYFKVQKKQ